MALMMYMKALFIAGLIFYALGTLAAWRYFAVGSRAALWTARAGATLGGLAIAAVLICRWAAWGRPPLTTPVDSIGLLLLVATLVALIEGARRNMEGVLGFFLPMALAIYIVNTALGFRQLEIQPKALNEWLLSVHVGLALLAYALFFAASLMSLLYLLQSASLKRRRATTGPFHRLPSLEQLDQSLCRLIWVGYPLFVVTLVLGAFWAHHAPNLLSATWWLSPKVQMAYVMALFYAVCAHGRQLGWLRGRKLAQLVSGGFTTLLVAYVLMALLSLRDWNFWGQGV